MKKKFIDLKPGDRVFEIFDDNSIGIYEIVFIEIRSSSVYIFVNSIIGIDRETICFNHKINSNFSFYSYAYGSNVYSNEEDFLDALNKE